MLLNKQEVLIIGTPQCKSIMMVLAGLLDVYQIKHRTPCTDFIESNFLQTEIFSLAVVFGDMFNSQHSMNLQAEINKVAYLRDMKYGGFIIYVSKYIDSIGKKITSDPKSGEILMFKPLLQGSEVVNLNEVVEIIKSRLESK